LKFGQWTSQLMWRPSVIDWWNNAWYLCACVQHSSWLIQLETVELFTCGDSQLWSAGNRCIWARCECQELNAIFYLPWRVTSCWWWGVPRHLSNLFSESGLHSTVRRQGSTSMLQHLHWWEQLSHGTTIYRRPNTVCPEHHFGWSIEPARRLVVGSLPDTMIQSHAEVTRWF